MLTEDGQRALHFEGDIAWDYLPETSMKLAQVTLAPTMLSSLQLVPSANKDCIHLHESTSRRTCRR